MHRAILFLALTACPLWACCPFDPDTLASESASMPGMLELIAGKIERLPAAHYQKELDAALAAMGAEPENFEYVRRAAEAHDMLFAQREGLRLLESFPPGKLTVAERAVRDGLLARLYIHLWLAELDPVPDTAERALAAWRTGSANRLLGMVLEWACNAPPVNASEMLPDFFALRLAANKTALADNDQLKTMNLAEVPQFLGWLLKLHPLWENVDTYYTLSLTLAVMGKQHLAYLARLRAFEFLDQQKTTRLSVPHDAGDLRALMIPRHYKGGALTEIPTLADVTKKQIASEYASRREDARRWLAARGEFALRKLAQGKSPATDAAFWQDFNYAPAAVSGPAPAANSPPEGVSQNGAGGVDTTVIVAAASSAVVVLVAMASVRRRRKLEPRPGPKA